MSWDQPISASLARQLAEAADGFRTGESIWFIAVPPADTAGQHEIVGPFKSGAEARKDPSASTHGSAIFGPYETPRSGSDLATTGKFLLEIGDGRSIELRASDYDTITWNPSAVRKFLVPYYASQIDGTYAAALQELIDRKDVLCLLHKPKSIIVEFVAGDPHDRDKEIARFELDLDLTIHKI